MSNSNTKNAIQQMAEKIMPGLQTDHGGINLGDIVVLIMSSVLLIYTGYRSWHFISLSIPDDFQVLALVGLWGIDIGMIGWAVTWIFGSSSPGQDGVSMAMWIIDVIAMVLTSVIDTIMYADGNTIPAIFKTIAWYGIPIIIVGNAIMAIIYHYTSPATKYRRMQRKLDARMDEARQKGDHEISEMTATANMLQDYTMKRANALLSIASVADQNVQMVDLEQQVLKRLNGAGLGHLAGPLAHAEAAPSPTRGEPAGKLSDTIGKIKSLLGDRGHAGGPIRKIRYDGMTCIFCESPNVPKGELFCSATCEKAYLQQDLLRTQNRLALFVDEKQPVPMPTYPVSLRPGANGSSPKAVG